MRQIYFFFKHITIAGAELLMEKFSDEWEKEGNKVTVFCCDLYPEMKKKFKNNNINIVELQKWDYKTIKHQLKFSRCPICITFEWDIFLRIYFLKIPQKRTIFYAIDYAILAFGYHRKNSIFKSTEKCIVCNALHDMVQNGHVICMDEQTIRFTINYLGNSCKIQNSEIIRVPVNSSSEEKLIVNRTNQRFNILSIARADFPFKGYLLGLVDFMKKTDSKTYLKIVTYGKDEMILRNKINCLPKEVKKRISLFGKVEYDELNKFYNETNLYIGMGSTIIDAAMLGIISIPVVARTEKLISTHYFNEDYRDVAIDYTENDKTFELYNKVRNMPYEQLYEMAKDSQKLAVDNYSIHRLSKKFLDYVDSNVQLDKPTLNLKKMLVLRSIVKKIKRQSW